MAILQSELNELKNFIADLKGDRATQKEKEKREAWTKYTSLSIVFIAVLAAVATQWSGKYSSRVLVALNDATFDQAKASDQCTHRSDTAQTDLNYFSDTFGIPRAKVRTPYVKGRPKTVSGIWTLETALDVEWAHTVAPGAKILLVTTKTSSFNDLLNGVDAAVKAGATQVSTEQQGLVLTRRRGRRSSDQKTRMGFVR